MSNYSIKDVQRFTELDENNNEIQKSRMIVVENGVEREILLTGNGEIKIATKV